MATPPIILDKRTTITLGAHNITKPPMINIIEDVINIGRLPTKSDIVPENMVTTVPVIKDIDTINPSSVGFFQIEFFFDVGHTPCTRGKNCLFNSSC
jgi:hypothetical protein